MRFRHRLFTVLALLTLIYAGSGIVYTSNVVSRQTAPAGYDATQTTSYNVGVGLGSGISYLWFVCTGIPLWTLFSLLAWRNRVGYERKQAYNEMRAMFGSTAWGIPPDKEAR